MFILFCIVLVLPPVAILILVLQILKIWNTIDDINDIICENIFKDLDSLDESVDDILAYLEDGGNKKK